MGTKENQTGLQAASAAVSSPTEVLKNSSSNSSVSAANNQNSTHSSDLNSGNIKSSRSNVAKSTTQINSQNANTNSSTTTTITTTAITSTTIATTTATTTPHHSKAQVIIIPATPASTVATNAAKKIRRAFSMPRNPFQWSRKFKTSGGGRSNETADGSDSGGSGGGGNSALSACVGGGRSGRHGSIVSLNSYTAVSKETDVATTTDASTTTPAATTSQQPEKKSSNTPSGSNAGGANRVFRRTSLRKFINRIAQHVSTSVNIGATDKSAFSGLLPLYTGCWRRKEAHKHVSSQTNSLSSTDRVPPIGGYQWPADQTPGVTGLKNHGNTCFMNAVLQCLSHTDILAEYFVLDQYKSDLKRRNKINSRKFGTKGELTEQLANVLKALWTCKNESDHSTSFKAVVDRYGSQFRSSTQHDAQEFLFWLLDKVHEDLNTATKRRYKSVKSLLTKFFCQQNSYGRPDEVIAAETLANHIRCNNSFVQAVFQAQFRSSLTCPRCKKQSNTFDPFHCISVQLPQLAQQTIFVTVLYHKQHPRQVKLGLTVPAGSPIVALREQLHIDTGIASDRIVLVDINETGFTRVYYDTQPVSTLVGADAIYCIEVPPEEEKKPSSGDVKMSDEVVNDATKKSTSANTQATTDLLLLVANMRKRKKSQVDEISTDINANVIERFGMPHCLRVPRDITYSELQKKLLREMSGLLKEAAFTSPLSDMFKIRLQDPSADPDTYLEQVEHPLLTEMIDLALSVLSAEAGPAHIKLLLEWPEPELHFVDITTNPPLVEHESVARLMEQRSQDTAALTLEQCLEHYTKAETLSAEDAWRCPHCQQYLPVVKTLGLWSLPDILVVHFKRFRQHQAKGSNAAKLTTMVKFPLNAFDMAPHLAKGTCDQQSEMKLHSSTDHHHNRPSPWRKTARNPDSRSSTLESNRRETRYDLYAVCYHQGDTLETGHYTAACKNPYDHQWYKFDDQRVSRVPSVSIEQDIINNEAYMLFYQRRRTDVAECSGSSSTSGEHWVSKIAPPTQVQNVEKSSMASTNKVVSITTAETPKVSDNIPEKAETKPVEIPKVEVVTVEVPQIPKQDTLTQKVVNEKGNPCDITNIEGIQYADDVAEDAETDDLNILESLAPRDDISSTPNTTEYSNQMFVMDEDCKVKECDESNVSTSPIKSLANVKQENKEATQITPVKSKSPLLTAISNVKKATVEIENLKEETHLANENSSSTIAPKPNISSAVVTNSASASSSSSSLSSHSSPHSLAASTFGASTLQNKFNGFSVSFSQSTVAAAKNYKESLLSSSLKSNSSSIIAVATAHANDLQNNRSQYPQHWHGSRSSVSALENVTSSSTAHQAAHHTHCLNLRHSFSTSSNFKLKECSDTLSSLFRNSANTCSKDTLIFIDQQNHHHHHNHHRHHNHNSLMEDDDDTFLGSRSLWISPVTPHKLITVSPKN